MKRARSGTFSNLWTIDMDDFKTDPEKYAAMSRLPFPTDVDANFAMDMFCSKVKELHENYRIAEVVVVAQVYLEPDKPNSKKGINTYFTCGDLAEGFFLTDAAMKDMAVKFARAVTARTPVTEEPVEAMGKGRNKK